MIGIVVALKKEAENFLLKSTNIKKIKFLDKECYIGKFNNIKFVLAISGIGKVSSGLTTQRIIDKFKPKIILNFGSCGGINEKTKVLEYYQVDKVCQYDFDVTAIDDVEVGYIQEYKRVFFDTTPFEFDFLQKRTLATADRFSEKLEDLELLQNKNCDLRDMEGGAIAQVCISNNQDFIIIKGVSDVEGSGSTSKQFLENLDSINKNFPNVLEKIFKNIK